MKFLAHFFSTLFLPLLIPLISSLLIVWANPYAFGGAKSPIVVTFLYYIILCTFIMPAVGLFMMKKLQLVDDFDLKDRQQRIVPYFLIIICYSIAFYMLINLPIPSMVKAMMFASLASIIISFFWNNFIKISAHANGMGSLLGVVIGLLFMSHRNIEAIFFMVLLCCGFVLSSRLYLRAHSLREVSFGFLLGLLTQLFTFFIFFRFGL